MEWSKKQTLDLIELFHAQECLWNVKNEVYKDRQKKKDALAEIALQMDINVNDIDRKLTNLKNQFNREVNKMKTKSGCGTDDVYVSPWYAFKPLGFLKSNNLAKPARSSGSIAEEHDDGETSPIEDEGVLTDMSTRPRKVLKRGPGDSQKEALCILKEAHEKIIQRQAKDEFHIFGEYVASELRGINGKRNILELKKQIQDLIYSTKLKEINYERNVSSRPLASPDVMEVAANVELDSEDEEIISDTFEYVRDKSGNILIREK